jgi:diadenosine tetraphosphatase ApaH/serine/threonine PP2A family protein phosphatase
MQLALISDIHGNRQALEAVLDDITRTDAVEIVRETVTICLAGNHDLAVTGALSLSEFSRGAEIAARWTREVMEPENVDWLRRLLPQDLDRSIGLYHASPRDPIWEYVLSALLAELCLDAQTHRICAVGHSHVALSFVRREGELATGEPRRDGDELDLSQGEWLINPGSVGQPRDGDPRAAWLLLDLDRRSATWRRVAYDIGKAQAAIRAARLPDSLADRLSYGQ